MPPSLLVLALTYVRISVHARGRPKINLICDKATRVL